MTREEREAFVRETLDTDIANAVQVIVDQWENEVNEHYQDGLSDGWRER